MNKTDIIFYFWLNVSVKRQNPDPALAASLFNFVKKNDKLHKQPEACMPYSSH